MSEYIRIGKVSEADLIIQHQVPQLSDISYSDWIAVILTKADGTVRWEPSKRVNTRQSLFFLEQSRKSQIKFTCFRR